MPTVNFRTNAKVESLVGRDLITNNVIAIFELVKNSYDAGATRVDIVFNNFKKIRKNEDISNEGSYIQVIDNGKGMTFKEINDYWMELGTPYKEENKTSKIRLRQNEIETVVKRTVNGEKGIGRFGVDKIGSYLKLISIDKDLKEKTKVHFDWNKFDDRNKLLEEVNCEYEIEGVTKNETSGLSLEIHKLRDTWFESDLIKLKRSLSKFLSPLPIQQDEFRIFLNYKYVENGETFKEIEEISNDSFDYLKTKIYAELDTSGLVYYEIHDNQVVVESDEQYFYSSPSPFGAATVEIYYLNPNDKRVFSTKMGMRTSDYGNIKIFRDSFRVMPYGEPDNDWLEIDKEHAQGIFRTFGTRDLVGHIIISHDAEKKNDVLREATDRVGLIEDVVEFKKFKEFIWKLIITLQTYVFNKIKNESKETTKILKKETEDLRKDANSIMSSFEDILEQANLPLEEKDQLYLEFKSTSKDFINSITTVENATEEIEKKIKIFSQMINKEGILYEMLHSIKNKLTIIDAQIRGFELEIELAKLTSVSTYELKTAFSDIFKLVEGSLDKVNSTKLKKELFYVNNIIQEVANSQKSYLYENDIEMDVNILKSIQFQVKCSPESLKVVFENLFSNSIKALSGIENKKIFITSEISGDFVEIYFSDNGEGVPKNKEKFIFSLWSSGTGGTGIGLAASKDIIEEHKGEILYVDLNDQNKKTTFLIKLPIIRKVGEII